MKTFFKCLYIVHIFSLMTCVFSEQSSEIAELKDRIYKLKAVFIFNFAKYIQWPEYDTSNNFIIGVLGTSGITESLQRIALIRKTQGKKIEIRQYNHIDEIDQVQILFIDSLVSVNLTNLSKNQLFHHILLVGDKQGLAKQGAAISFFIEDGKVKFELNINNLKNADLSASSQLLNLAKIVE